MHLEVLNTGSELLLGQVLNTHLPFLAERLFPLGITIARQLTVPDGPAIADALQESFARADVVIVTGGLGPTTDDLTREITAELLDLPLDHDPEIEQAIAARFQRRGIPLSDRVMRQAMKPRTAEVLPNAFGTAPGLYLAPRAIPSNPSGKHTPHLFLLPGPPRELKPMVETSVLPKLRALLPDTPRVLMRTWRVLGVPESSVESAVGETLLALGVDLGYCARLGEVDVRIIGSESQLESAEAILKKSFHDSMLPSGSKPLEDWIIEKMTSRHLTLATAESCTGGSIANRLTNVPGASAVFRSGQIPYANTAKEALGVPSDLLATHGAVSSEVARALAQAVRKSSGASFGLSTTGIAGPGGGTPEKPLGTVFIGLSAADGTEWVEKYVYTTDRLSFKQLVTQSALNLLRQALNH